MDLFNCNKKNEPTNEVSGVEICKEKTFFRTQFDIKKIVMLISRGMRGLEGGYSSLARSQTLVSLLS